MRQGQTGKRLLRPRFKAEAIVEAVRLLVGTVTCYNSRLWRLIIFYTHLATHFYGGGTPLLTDKAQHFGSYIVACTKPNPNSSLRILGCTKDIIKGFRPVRTLYKKNPIHHQLIIKPYFWKKWQWYCKLVLHLPEPAELRAAYLIINWQIKLHQ